MSEYLTDDEQVERIKKWWSENGSSVIAGLVIGFGLLGGWRFYVDYKENVAAEASAHFSDMLTAVQSSKHDDAIQQANVLLEEYSTTVYADLARLSLAKAFVETGKYDQAEQQLQLLVDNAAESSLQMVARTRLAAVMFQQQKMSQALEVLDVSYPDQFAAAFEELKGDILAAQGDKQRAREAYQKAQLAQPPAPDTQFLQQKLEDLGMSVVAS